MRHKLVLLSIISFLSLSIVGQTRIIHGRVISEDLETLPKVNIQNADTLLIGETDINGQFKIEIPLSTEKLLFSWIGMEWTTTHLTDCDTLEIIMMCYAIYDFMSSNKIDRLRKERYDKLPELHSKAVNQGLFLKKEMCYSIDFVPFKPELDVIGEEMKIIRKQNRIYFKNLNVGDTIRIPYSGSYGSDGTDRTTLNVFSIYSEGSDYDCIISGIITGKNKHKGGYNLVYRVIDCDECKYDKIVFRKKELVIGDKIEHDMKYFKVLIE